MRLALIIVSWSIAASASVAPAWGQVASHDSQPSAVGIGAPAEGLVLLRNGELLAGTVSRAGDYFLIVSPQAELQVRAVEVEAVCRDLEEVLRHKRRKVNEHSPDERLDLAQWCIDRRLFGPAARELTEAYRLDDLHPRLPLLERRLKAAMMPAKAIEPPAAKPTSTVDEAQADAVAKGIGAEALHDFTIRVQPLLMNYCATAGCHGPKAASTFRLERVYLNERNDPRSVKRNLYAVMGQIDRGVPGASRLLTMPLAAHGGRSTPIFTVHNVEHYRQLAVWVQRVVGLEKTSAPTGATAAVQTPQQLLQRVPLAAPMNESTAPPRLGGEAQPTPAAPSALPTTGPSSPESKGVVDPFDPAAFNRAAASSDGRK